MFEGGRRLVRVVEVAQRNGAAARQHADLADRAGPQLLIDHHDVGVRVEYRRGPGFTVVEAVQRDAGLRGAQGVPDDAVGQRLAQLRPHARRQRRRPVGHRQYAVQIPTVRFGQQRFGKRASGGIAEDGDRGDLGSGRQVERLSRVEAALGGHDESAAGDVAVAQDPLGAAVHQRSNGENPHRELVSGRLRAELLDAVQRGIPALSIQRAADQVLLAPHHTLGQTGGAAGVQDVKVVAAAAGDAAPR
ncbi:hypothetical protein A4G27_21155 [Mycobacterium kansasii]|nr:hypothetical protein A4G27_21155 [Mycobacterium kansasii]